MLHKAAAPVLQPATGPLLGPRMGPHATTRVQDAVTGYSNIDYAPLLNRGGVVVLMFHPITYCDKC